MGLGTGHLGVLALGHLYGRVSKCFINLTPFLSDDIMRLDADFRFLRTEYIHSSV